MGRRALPKLDPTLDLAQQKIAPRQRIAVRVELVADGCPV